MKKKHESTLYNDLKQSLNEAIAYKHGKVKAKIHRRKVNVAPLPHYAGMEVRKLREKLNLSQRTFAEIIGVSVKAIEAWESGRAEPNGSAQRVLSLIDHDEKSLEKYELLEIS